MDFIKMIMELPGEKRSQDVVEHTEWNNLWKLIVTQGNHSENYLEQLYNYFFNEERGWVYKVQAELNGVQPYVEGVMTQPVGKAPDGSLWTYPSTESGTVPWGNIMGDITDQQDLIQKFGTKSDVGHKHFGMDLILTTGDIQGFVIADGSIGEAAYGSKSIPTSALKDLSVTSEKLNNGAVTTAKIASSAVINDSIANGSVSGAKITDGAVTQSKLSVSGRCGSVISATAGKNLENSDAGNTYFAGWTSGGSVRTWTLNAELSAAISNGFTVAFTELWQNDKTRINISGVRLVHRGDGTLLEKTESAVLGLVERGNMIALQKMFTDAANGDVWLITGDVEVIS